MLRVLFLDAPSHALAHPTWMVPEEQVPTCSLAARRSPLSPSRPPQVLEHVGTAVAGVDVDDADAMANISRSSDAPHRVWSKNGADFFFVVTFADGGVKRVAISGSFRCTSTQDLQRGICCTVG